MSKNQLSKGTDLLVTKLDRGYAGAERTVMKIDGETGDVAFYDQEGQPALSIDYETGAVAIPGAAGEVQLESQRIYLSPTGSDANDGTFSEPVATLPVADGKLSPLWLKDSELIFLDGTYTWPVNYKTAIPVNLSGQLSTARAWKGGLSSELGSRASTVGSTSRDLIDSTIASFRTGAAASITTVTGSDFAKVMTVTGLTGLTAADVGKLFMFGLATSAGNNGVFKMASFISATSATFYNAQAVVENSGLLYWQDTYEGSFMALDAKINCVAVANLVNNDRFTALGESNTIYTFEYKVNGSYVPVAGRITIDVSALTTANDVAIATQLALTDLLFNGTSVFQVTVVNATAYVRTARNIGAALTETVADPDFTVASAQARKIDYHGDNAVGSMTITSLPLAGNTLILNDGTNPTTTLTWVAAAPGALDVLIGATEIESAANLRTKINTLAPTTCRIRATNTAGSAVIQLKNMLPGSSGNQSHSQTGAWATFVVMTGGVGTPTTTFSTIEAFSPAPAVGDLFQIQNPTVTIDIPGIMSVAGPGGWGTQGIKFRCTGPAVGPPGISLLNVLWTKERCQIDLGAGLTISAFYQTIWNAAGTAYWGNSPTSRMLVNNGQCSVFNGTIALQGCRGVGRAYWNQVFHASSTLSPGGLVNGFSEFQYPQLFARRSTFIAEKGTVVSFQGNAGRNAKIVGTLRASDLAAIQIQAGSTLSSVVTFDISDCPNHGLAVVEGANARVSTLVGRGNGKTGIHADLRGAVSLDPAANTTITGELGDTELNHETTPHRVSYATIRTVDANGMKGYPELGNARAVYGTRFDA